MLVPQVHVLSPSAVGSMPQEQIKAVLHQCAENSHEVEIEYSADGKDGKCLSVRIITALCYLPFSLYK